MIAVRLPEALEAELERVASETHRSKSYYIRKALKQYLEDRQDYIDAMEVLAQKNPTYSFSDVVKDLDLDY